MINKNFETIKCVLDLLIIFAPFILLFDDGIRNFLILFYLIYLPSLIFSVLELRYKKKDLLFKRSIPIKTKNNKKSKTKELTISN
jgi:hypothetical protein